MIENITIITEFQSSKLNKTIEMKQLRLNLYLNSKKKGNNMRQYVTLNVTTFNS